MSDICYYKDCAYEVLEDGSCTFELGLKVIKMSKASVVYELIYAGLPAFLDTTKSGTYVPHTGTVEVPVRDALSTPDVQVLRVTAKPNAKSGYTLVYESDEIAERIVYVHASVNKLLHAFFGKGVDVNDELYETYEMQLPRESTLVVILAALGLLLAFYLVFWFFTGTVVGLAILILVLIGYGAKVADPSAGSAVVKNQKKE